MSDVADMVDVVNMVDKAFNRLLLSLLLLTALALYAHANWMTRIWRVDNLSTIIFSAIDDSPDGGKSHAKITKTKDGLELDCQIALGYQWPYCELALRFSDEKNGVDLRAFDSLRLKIRSEGPEPTNQIRVFLRNYNPAYSKAKASATLKPHEIVYDPSKESPTVEFKLNQFAVASWWVQEHPSDSSHVGPELDNVSTISISTGGNVEPGSHKIVLESAEFVGQWIPAASFRLAIISIWMFSIMCYLLWQWKASKEELKQSDRLKAQLHNANEILEMRVNERTRALASSNARLIESLQNLENARHELVENEKNAALGSLVSGIAHELNTPIGNAVLVNSTLIDSTNRLEKALNEKLTKKLLTDFIAETKCGTEILKQNLERTATLIGSFKQLSADQHSGQRRKFPLDEVVNETLMVMAPKLSQTSHDLKVDVDPAIKMDSYPGPLSQIFMNFINNALLHAFEEISHGHMTLVAKLIDNETVEINFTDNGIGIPAPVLRRVFEPFFTTKLGKGGSGLGMHLAHTMVTQIFGGKIEITSVLGEGTRIQLVLPLVAPIMSNNLFKIGVPSDVLSDYYTFLGDRSVLEIVEFSGSHARRDVVEVALFLRTLQLQLPQAKIELCAVDSYANGIDNLRAGLLSALGTSSWKTDLATHQAELIISDAILQEGESIVGIYTAPSNTLAHNCRSLDDFRPLRFVSNSDWSADWHTLKALGVEHCLDVKTWRQMVYMVSAGEVDALLSPFPVGEDLCIELDDCTLTPVPNLTIALHGSRHFAVAKNPRGEMIADKVFPELCRLVNDGSIHRAMHECGFFNATTKDWPVLNEENNPSPHAESANVDSNIDSQ
ncbi:sensor histidine kinase [Undibacterium flavidum]|uniref:histidine kinase n=1 Tax=Undibacterium flavidum TaxID=2762297 RepID=A0ABR6Y724_9BURK|nr:HAMP domain-containing sensor histidine kinase [Undibacterium flavidum]MBC3871957.1 HAMP domain-containing histidine kinase [Undibacterium flavidum]